MNRMHGQTHLAVESAAQDGHDVRGLSQANVRLTVRLDYTHEPSRGLSAALFAHQSVCEQIANVQRGVGAGGGAIVSHKFRS